MRRRVDPDELVELLPGLFRWTAIHPEADPDATAGSPADWGPYVGCVAYAAPDALVLVDPLVPADRPELQKALDALVAAHGQRVAILTTLGFHRRSRDELAERYGASTSRARKTLPEGVEAIQIRGAGETMFWLPEHGAARPRRPPARRTTRAACASARGLLAPVPPERDAPGRAPRGPAAAPRPPGRARARLPRRAGAGRAARRSRGRSALAAVGTSSASPVVLLGAGNGRAFLGFLGLLLRELALSILCLHAGDPSRRDGARASRRRDAGSTPRARSGRSSPSRPCSCARTGASATCGCRSPDGERDPDPDDARPATTPTRSTSCATRPRTCSPRRRGGSTRGRRSRSGRRSRTASTTTSSSPSP